MAPSRGLSNRRRCHDNSGNPVGYRAAVGQILSWTAYRGGVEVLVAEEYWTGTGDTSEWGPSMASMIHDVLIGKA